MIAVIGPQEHCNSRMLSSELKNSFINCESHTSNLSEQLSALNINHYLKMDRPETVIRGMNNTDTCSEEKNCMDVACINVPDKSRLVTKRCNFDNNVEMVHCNLVDESCSSSVFYYIASEETHVVVHPYGASEGCKPRHKVTFKSVGGLHKQVGMVREMIELPLKHPEFFSTHGRWLIGQGNIIYS